jgi:hypothetical protein
MADALFVLLIVAFFGLAVLLVRGCDRLVGPDPELPTAAPPAPAERETVSA